MHYFLFVKLEGFYARTLQGIDRKLSERPLVVHQNKRVLDANEHAMGAGVRVGASLSEAKTIAAGGAFVAWEEETFRTAQEEWLDVCTTYSDRIEPHEQHACYLDLSHPQPKLIAADLCESLHRNQGLTISAGLAQVKWIAQAAASFGQGLHVVENTPEFLSKLPVRLLLPATEEERVRLKFLGYRRAGDLLSVHLDVLQKQFGARALAIHSAVRGGVREEVQAVYPKASIADRMCFESPVEELECLDRAIKTLSFRLGKRLEASDQQGSEISLTIEGDGCIRQFARKFTKPMQAPRSLYASLKLILKEALRDSDEGVVSFRVRMPNLTPSLRTQGSLLQTKKGVSEKDAFHAVRTALGDSAVRRASEITEPRRKLVLRYLKDVSGWS
jgi:DNA polymerase IV